MEDVDKAHLDFKEKELKMACVQTVMGLMASQAAASTNPGVVKTTEEILTEAGKIHNWITT